MIEQEQCRLWLERLKAQKMVENMIQRKEIKECCQRNIGNMKTIEDMGRCVLKTCPECYRVHEYEVDKVTGKEQYKG